MEEKRPHQFSKKKKPVIYFRNKIVEKQKFLKEELILFILMVAVTYSKIRLKLTKLKLKFCLIFLDSLFVNFTIATTW